MPDAPRIRIVVACALPDRAFRRELALPAGSTVAAAIDASGVREAFPEVEIHPDRLGIFSKRVAPDRVLCDGDRVEIYRPLRIDPKEARRKRAMGA